MAMKTGFGAVQEAIERSAERSGGGGNFLRTLVWKDDRKDKGELFQHTVRFLTDEVMPCKIYEFIPCKDGKMRDFIIPSSVDDETKDPDVVKQSGVRVPEYGNKNNLIEPRAKDVTLGIVVLREEISEMVDGRRVLSYKDKMETIKYEKDGVEVEETRPAFRLVKQSNKNFWSVVSGYYGRYGTITDRDYEITRNRNDKDTNYTIIPCDPIEDLRTPEDLEEAYNPPTTLENIVKDLASPERARKLLFGDSDEEGENSRESSSDEKPSKESSTETPKDTQFSDLRKQLLEQ